MTHTTARGRLLATTMISGIAVAALSVASAQAQSAPAPITTGPPGSTTTGAGSATEPTSPSGSNGTTVQEFVVTGSRIPQPNLTGVSPVTTVNSQQVKLQGTTNVEDLINNLPQAFADFGQFESNGSTGTATVDLRGLGNTRTLVLIDDKRLQPGDPTVPAADLNMIPPALIDRVEVLTGGASAVYGSDAVAGVVNFIMKKNFEGIQVDAETSIAEHGNNNQQVRADNKFGSNNFGFPSLNLPSGSVWTGQRHTVTITGGANSPDGKGNVEFYLGYTSIDGVTQAQYDYSACAIATNTSNTLQQYCSGSTGTTATGRLRPLTGPNAGVDYNILGAPVGGVLPPFFTGLAYNFNPLNYIQRPDTRYTAGEFSHYEITPHIDAYSSFMFMDDHTVAQIAPSGAFFGERTFTIPCNDPLLSAPQATALCGPEAGTPTTAQAFIGRRNVEGGPRTSDIEHLDYRAVVGLKGDLGSGWSYDVSAQYGKSVLTEISGGYLLYSKLLNALNVVTSPTTGLPTCVSALPGGGDANCVPYNIWSPNGVTKQALNYLTGTAERTGYTTEQVVTGSVTGDLGQYGMKSPWATQGLGISIGAEYRREYLQTRYDQVLESGDLGGGGGPIPDTTGSQSDKDVFAEARVPLIQDVPLVKDLTFEGGYRYSNYTSGGGNSTYKLGLDWQVVSDFKLRASYERAVRAPNVQELFLPDSINLLGAIDPCGGATPGFTAAQCANTFQHLFPGVSVAELTAALLAPQGPGNPVFMNGGAVGPPVYGNITQCISGQCNAMAGGNPDLQPEIASTKSVGIVFTPAFFHGFSFTVDYFNIRVNKAIVTVPAALIFNECGLNDVISYCNLITRNAGANYGIFGGTGPGEGNIFTQTLNVGSLVTKGVDVNADYRLPLSNFGWNNAGSLGFNFTGTYVHDLTTTILTESYDCSGYYGLTCGTPTPKWRHQFRVSWTTPWNLTLSANWRYLSATKLDSNSSQAALAGAPDINPSDARIPDFSYFDLAFTYKLKDRYTLRGGVNNIFDRTPPLISANSIAITAPPFGNGNTYPQVFDPLGRVLFLGLTADF